MNGQDEMQFQTQRCYWIKLQQFKFDLIYYSLHFSDCTSKLRSIKYISTVGTIVATFIWRKWSNVDCVDIVCMILIFLLQILSAVSEQFPYEKRRQELREMCNELAPLYIKMESDWRWIANGKYNIAEIEKLIKQYETRQSNIKKHYFKEDTLPEKKRIENNANIKTKEYFDNLT